MLPLLFLPVAVPEIIAAVEATSLVLGGGELDRLVVWLPMLGAFDAIFLVVCPFAFQFVGCLEYRPLRVPLGQRESHGGQ